MADTEESRPRGRHNVVDPPVDTTVCHPRVPDGARGLLPLASAASEFPAFWEMVVFERRIMTASIDIHGECTVTEDMVAGLAD